MMRKKTEIVQRRRRIRRSEWKIVQKKKLQLIRPFREKIGASKSLLLSIQATLFHLMIKSP
jgi:hypothetical protein